MGDDYGWINGVVMMTTVQTFTLVINIVTLCIALVALASVMRR